ncbi:hypothetical protein AAFN85_13585 [Mucilaginibacter sp. CAU 1740]|uniref:hypothetical protein n=1 Tax=Mucilaginibacter sp. CAU 1740 TaxID=3140365 RepID=UPI00325AE144
MGLVVQLRDSGLQSPEQILRVFFRLYDPEAVKAGLLQVFGAVVKANDAEGNIDLLGLDEVAVLFDELLNLTRAVEALISDPPERCPVCGRVE